MFWCFWSKECLGEWEDVVVISAQELEWENTGSSLTLPLALLHWEYNFLLNLDYGES